MPDLLAKAESRTKSVSSSHVIEPVTEAFPELLVGGSASVPFQQIRAGNSATLLLEGTRIHIRLHVVFAQSGHVGDTVRVTTPDRKQVYVAKVLTPEFLKGEL